MTSPRLRHLWIRAVTGLCAAGWLTLPLGAADNGGWVENSRSPNLTISQRDHPGSAIKEVRAVGTFDVPNWVIKNVLDDTDHYADFMPYIVASRVLSRDPAHHTMLAYAQMDPPLVSPRDYTLLIHDEPTKAADGAITYQNRWEPANGQGPAEKSGVVRVKVNEGSWELEPTDGGTHTKGTYTLYTDGGGGIPAMLYNSLSTKRLKELFEAVEKRAQMAQYQKTKPPGP